MLTTVGAGALFGTDAPVGCGCIGAGRSLALRLGVGVGMGAGIGVALLLGSLCPRGLLARTLGLLSCRLVDVLGLGSGIGGSLGGLVLDGLGLGVDFGLRLRRALCRGATATAGADIGGLGIGRCGSLGGRSVLDPGIGRGRRLGRHRCTLGSSCCGSGFLGLNIRLGLAAATMRA